MTGAEDRKGERITKRIARARAGAERGKEAT